ncbi:MAG: tRNA (adenosine(37)-N6)-threonylcarbamoyltransferase complex ATPase subunit type 1 TsaE [Anaerosomatales bacterium]|nr:tRNA (adenosine(37)-N6)-threonylcarbamoyltransferase complex ATPase subunit type 1 TsaE [Anaerosomatales bacterium]
MRAGFKTRSAGETVRAGELLARLLAPGDVVALSGDLGAGKTHLVQGVAHGLGVAEPVTSPTFNLLVVHPGRVPLHHFDLYRLERAEELDDIAFAETLESGGVSLIEWGDKFPGELPADHVEVVIRVGEGDERVFEVRGTGVRSASVAEAWLEACEQEGLR